MIRVLVAISLEFSANKYISGRFFIRYNFFNFTYWIIMALPSPGAPISE